ncbi:MAG: class I SAM-dependent methyltransferase [Desulfamplus sp.]|nr:class I SAM-dependent methyltransferase [Desulfamplus sp.]
MDHQESAGFFISHEGVPQYNIPNYLSNIALPWASTLTDLYNNPVTFPASLSPSQGEFIKSIVANIAPDTIVEIGCFVGVSTLWIAAALEQIGSNAILHSIDLFNCIQKNPPYSYAELSNPMQFVQNNLEKAYLSHRVRLHKDNSACFIKKIMQFIPGGKIDFLFIDGDHSRDGCSHDFNLFQESVSNGGYIMFHDIYPECCTWDGPRHVLDNYIKNSDKFEMIEIPTTPFNYGIALVRKI